MERVSWCFFTYPTHVFFLPTCSADEETIALKSKMKNLKSENDKLQAYIDDKLGITALPKGNELLSLAEDFYSNEHVPNEHLPQHIRLALTTEEIQDLRRVFELFDVKNKG